MIKTTLSIGVLLLFWAASAMGQAPRRLLPKPLHKLEIGMGLEDFAQVRSETNPAELKREAAFRYVWKEDLKGKKDIEWVTYYFSDDAERRLYEFIIEYEGVKPRDEWIARNYGAPNAEQGTEWRFRLSDGTEVRAWCFQKRLVIVGVLPGTEWEGT